MDDYDLTRLLVWSSIAVGLAAFWVGVAYLLWSIFL